MKLKHCSLIYQLRICMLLIILAGALYSPASAQQFPVRVQVQCIPPFSPQLAGFYSGTQAKLIVTLINTDLQKPSLNVRLRFTIKSATVSLRNRDYGYYPPITLDAGLPVQLSLTDLAPYFNPDNLDVSGMSKAVLQQNGQLPDGYYTICAEAVEVNSGQLVSNEKQGCSPPAWLSVSEPPLLNLPRKGEAVAFREPLNIIFNWTPRHMSSPNAAFQTEYEFTLVEVWDNGILPEAAFGTMPPLYQTTTSNTTLLYGPTEPPLLPGKQYAWRIQAKAKQGLDEYAVFRNNGYSEIFYFRLQEDCQPPEQVAATQENGRINITWAPQPKMFEYIVEYREQDKANAEWFNVKGTSNSATINDAIPGHKYEYRVGGYCSQGNKTLGDTHAFEVPKKDTADKNCGILPDISITNQTPIQQLQEQDEIMAGDFPVRLLKVSGSGSFTGNGYITIPFIGYNRVKVKFENIKVNTDRQLIGGEIMTTYDPKGSQIADLDSVINMIPGLASIINKLERLIAGQDGGLENSDAVRENIGDLKDGVQELINDGTIKDPAAVNDLVKDLETQTAEGSKDPAAAAKAAETLEKIKDAINGGDAGTGAGGSGAGGTPLPVNKNYFMIEGKKYYSGDIVFMPLSDKLYIVKAYYEDGTLFHQGSIWKSGTIVVDAATAKYAPESTMNNMAGNVVRITDPAKTVDNELAIRIVPVRIEFAQSANQLYGYDENDPLKEDCYPSFKGTKPLKGIPWKSLNSNGTPDYVNVDIYPPAAANKVRFLVTDAINFKVLTDVPSSANQDISVSGTGLNKETVLTAQIGDFINDTMQIKLVSYKKITKKVKIILVNESNDDIQVVPVGSTTPGSNTVVVSRGVNKFLDSKPGGDDRMITLPATGEQVIVAGANKISETVAKNVDAMSTDIPRALIAAEISKVYKQALVEWDVDPTPYTKTLNFDLDRDSMLNSGTWGNPEMKLILDNCDTKDGYYNVFLVNYPSTGINGKMSFGQRLGFVFPGKLNRAYPPTNPANSLAHELGHGAFTFHHPFEDFGATTPAYPPRPSGVKSYTPKDTDNLMDWDSGPIPPVWPRGKIRKYHWDIIKRP